MTSFKLTTNDILLQNSHAVAFAARSPILPGHVIVTTKTPCKTPVEELPIVVYTSLWELAREYTKQLRERGFATGFNLRFAAGSEAGQKVDQPYIDVIPRREGDLEENDAIYRMIDEHYPSVGGYDEFP